MPRQRSNHRLRNSRGKAGKLTAENGASISLIENGERQASGHEPSVHHIESGMRNDEIRMLQKQLEKHGSGYADLFENAPVGYLILDEKGFIADANLTAALLLGVERNLLLNRPFLLLIAPESRDTFFRHTREVIDSPGRHTCEVILRRSGEGEQFFNAQLDSVAAKADGDKNMIRTAVIDVSERRLSEKKEETARLQTQKMEAIGGLAGGIAHDFNNILAAIIGFTEMVIEDVSDNPDVKHKMEQILQAGIRGRDLVRQILAFSRTGEGERKEVNLGVLVRETHALLRATLPSTIQMPLVITTEDDCVLADPAQVQQALLHLATNAAYAMREDGGQLTIKLSSVNFPEGSLFPDPDLEQGMYLKLTVKDTGIGMAEEVRQRIFEPFFTTKERGKGTGMGLAMVYGVVKSHAGAIRVQSEVGQGSTFEVFLPQTRRKEAAKESTSTAALPTGAERILFVDDEQLLVEMAHGMLKGLGYDVTVAKHGSEAWKLFIEDPLRFDLVITDQTMPDVTGVALAQQMLKVRQKMPIIICTGYSECVSAENAKALGIRAFVMKPIARKDMAQTVRKVLDESKAG